MTKPDDTDTHGLEQHRPEDRARLRGLLLAGNASVPTTAVDDTYFASLRSLVERASNRTGGNQQEQQTSER